MFDKFIAYLPSIIAPINTFSEIVSGFSTLIIAILTFFLWRENRTLRKAGSEPKLVAYYEAHPDGTGGLNIAIANVGTGPARNVYFQFIGDSKEFARYRLLFDGTLRRGPISMIPQGEKISMFFAVGYQLFTPIDSQETGSIAPFKIELEWSTLQGCKQYKDSFLLDVQPYAGLPGFINKPHLLKLVDSVDKVGKQIGALKPMIGNLTNIIEKGTLDRKRVEKVKGNTEVK